MSGVGACAVDRYPPSTVDQQEPQCVTANPVTSADDGHPRWP